MAVEQRQSGGAGVGHRGAELCGRARGGTYCGIICGSSAGVWGSGSGRCRCAEVVALMWH